MLELNSCRPGKVQNLSFLLICVWKFAIRVCVGILPVYLSHCPSLGPPHWSAALKSRMGLADCKASSSNVSSGQSRHVLEFTRCTGLPLKKFFFKFYKITFTFFSYYETKLSVVKKIDKWKKLKISGILNTYLLLLLTFWCIFIQLFIE